MKLLIDMQAAQTGSRYRGIGRQARSLATHLIDAAQSHDIFVLLNAGLTDGLEELRYEFLKHLPAENVKVFGIPGPVRELSVDNLWRMRAAELWRETVIADLRPEVVYVTSLFEGVVDDAVTSIGLMDAPHATAATLFDLIPLSDPRTYLAADFMQRFYYRRAQSLKRADRLIAISEFAKREAIEILQIPADRIDVALLAADSSFKRTSLSVDDGARLRAKYRLPQSFIFYVGAIEPRKNIALIIEAFGKLTPAERGDVAMVFGGRLSDGERAHLQTAAVRFGVDPARLVLPGYIAEADLAALYSMSRLFVFPSIQEGFGLPPLEAMACGAPVLVARNSSLPEVVGRADQMFGTFAADELAVKMARIFTDDVYADDLRNWGIARAAEFSWQKAGRQTLAALEDLHERHRDSKRVQALFRAKPRLAFVSPLPADRTGVANYASELLRELGCYYTIDCVINGTTVDDPWIVANFSLRDVDYFLSNSDQYDYVVYQFGNSEFHAHMFDLLAVVPGVVVLHDFFLSGVLDWLGNVGRRPKKHFLQQLYLTHGLPALAYLEREGRHAAADRYAANQVVFTNAHGVIVHSQWSIDHAREIYGESIADKMIRVPHLRALSPLESKLDARRKLGIDADAFVISTFGFVAETKFGDSLAQAWAQSAAGQAAGSALVFVGDHPPGTWGEQFEELVEKLSGDCAISVTGYTDRRQYELYLAATDVAVQLRRQTRGETSGAVLDCMGAGLPLIVNAHGPAAEIDPEIVLKLPEAFTVEELAQAIDRLFVDLDYRNSLAVAAREEMFVRHHPRVVGETVRDAIEHFTDETAGGRQSRIIRELGNMYAAVSPTEGDLINLAQTMAVTRASVGPNRIFYDITLLTESDSHTGIERVVRAFLSQMLNASPSGYRLEPVRFQNGKLFYAREFLANKFQIAANVFADTPIEYRGGDIYLAMEWAPYILTQMESYLQEFRAFGGRVVIGVYDLLPLLMPHRFPDFIPGASQAWFQTALAVADDLVCISRSVADDVLAYGSALAKGRSKPVNVNYFNLSAEISGSVPTTGVPETAEPLLADLHMRTTFLMVGTIEPRKGHRQVLEAFDLLWKQGHDINLVIVGRQGWMVEEISRVISSSREQGKRLHWIQGASDEYLERLYRSSSALIAASEGEGFGLPLIEAAARGIPLIARDLPVFREVAGESAYYFMAKSGAEMAAAFCDWLKLSADGAVPSSAGIRTIRWEESVGEFFDKIFGDQPYGRIGS